MAYNKDDFVVVPKPKKIGSYYRAILVAHNKSSVAIEAVSVSHHQIDKDGVTQSKLTQSTKEISPGEKREILHQEIYTALGHRTLEVTDITVKASDGTVFKAPLPASFSAPRCFVATAAYGDSGDPMVESFHCLRDEVLINHWAGRSFIDWYNRRGPQMAAMIEHRPLLRAAARMLLTPLAKAIMAFRKR